MRLRRFVFYTMIFVATLFVATFFFRYQKMATYSEFRSQYSSSDRALLDRNGYIIDEIRVDNKVRRLEWLDLQFVPEIFVKALLLAEDKRFYSHFGVDSIATFGSIRDRIVFGSARGASTITMQLAPLVADQKFVDERRSKTPRRTISQKLLQVIDALILDLKWSKNEILEAYINTLHYRGEIQGLQAASFGLFNKASQMLSEHESVVLASLVRSPSAKAERVLERACWLLKRIAGEQADCSQLSTDFVTQLNQKYRIRTFQNLAPHVSRIILKSYKGDLRPPSQLQSTIDRNIQWLAQNALQRQIQNWQKQNLTDGAVVVIENSTGHVLAYVGNIGEASRSRHVDAAAAFRQAGSTLKPFIYGQAIDEKRMTAATVLEDTPLEINVTTGTYRPSNFDRAFRELVSVRASLASSLNIPAVRALEIVTVDRFMQTMSSLGFSNLERPDFYGPSVALGSVDVRLIELTNAYRALANSGVWSPVRFQPSTAPINSKRILSPQASFIISDILSDREARVGTFGLENTLSTRFWTAVKTGTSKDMRDIWCVGFSEKYTVGVWAGNLNGDSMWSVSGVQGAAPVWQEIMNALHLSGSNRVSSQKPTPPPGLVKRQIYFTFSKQHQNEWFIAGTEPNTNVISAKKDSQSRIVYPSHLSLIAIDPDIPKPLQKLMIQVSSPQNDQYLYLNGRKLGLSQSVVPWSLRVGRQTLELRDQSGQVFDKIQFEVRGRQNHSI